MDEVRILIEIVFYDKDKGIRQMWTDTQQLYLRDGVLHTAPDLPVSQPNIERRLTGKATYIFHPLDFVYGRICLDVTFKVDVVALHNVRVVDVCPKAEGYPGNNWELSKYHEEEDNDDDDVDDDDDDFVVIGMIIDDEQLMIIWSKTKENIMT